MVNMKMFSFVIGMFLLISMIGFGSAVIIKDTNNYTSMLANVGGDAGMWGFNITSKITGYLYSFNITGASTATKCGINNDAGRTEIQNVTISSGNCSFTTPVALAADQSYWIWVWGAGTWDRNQYQSIYDISREATNIIFVSEEYDNSARTVRNKFVDEIDAIYTGTSSTAIENFSIWTTSPVNNTNLTISPITIVFNITGSLADGYSCNLFANDAIIGTKTSIENNTNVILDSGYLGAGSYIWYLNCTGGARTNVTQKRTVNIQNGGQLTLNLLNYSANGRNSTGFYTYGDSINATGVIIWNITQMILSKTTMPQGNVFIRLGTNDSMAGNLSNYTNFYDFGNTWNSDITENITILTRGNILEYFKIKDQQGQPIDGVLVRVEYKDKNLQGNSKFMGQRITGAGMTSGMTYFKFDSNSEAWIIISKDGYETQGFLMDVDQYSYDINNPYIILMKRSAISMVNGITITTAKYYSNDTNIGISVYAPSGGVLTYSTEFQRATINPNYTVQINLDTMKLGNSTIFKGTDYTGAGENVVISFWVDGVFWGNRTVVYKDMGNMISEPSGMNLNVYKFFIWIAFLFACAILGLFLKSESGGELVKSIFMIGLIIYGIVFVSSMGALEWIGLIFVGLRFVKGWIKE